MRNEIETLNNIGPYIADGFITRSIWNGRTVPLQNLQQLKDFIIRRANNVSENEARQRISDWLKKVTKNQRSSQCLNDARYRRVINGTERNYKIREWNYYAFNAVIEYWNSVIDADLIYQNRNIKAKIPRKIASLGARLKYPLQCQVNI